jgi:prevent-host-death family protein
MAMDVSVRDLKNRLSEYLRRVQAGEEVVVTSRGKAVARLSAPRSPQRGRLAEEQAVALVRSQPWIRAGKGKRRVPASVVRPKPGEKSLAEIVEEERR